MFENGIYIIVYELIYKLYCKFDEKKRFFFEKIDAFAKKQNKNDCIIERVSIGCYQIKEKFDCSEFGDFYFTL